jgi:hypothetical protein
MPQDDPPLPEPEDDGAEGASVPAEQPTSVHGTAGPLPGSGTEDAGGDGAGTGVTAAGGGGGGEGVPGSADAITPPHNTMPTAATRHADSRIHLARPNRAVQGRIVNRRRCS